MGYYVIMNEIERAEQDIGKKTMEWMGQLNAVGDQLQAYSGYLKEKSSGQTTDSICSYLEEVHMYLLGQFYMLLNEMFERVVCYAEGFYEIEADTYSGEIAQESLENQEEVLKEGNTAFLKEAQTLEDGLAKVSDILTVKAPDTSAVENGFGELTGQAEELRTKIGEYEAKHLSEDFEVMEAMEELLQSFMAHYSGKRAVSIETYQSRSFLEYSEVRALVQVESIKDAGREKNLEELQRTTELFINRMEAEARREAGKQKLVKGLLIAGGAVVTIVTVVATAGTATPVVATAWGQAFVIGSAGMATVYGVSETIEGYDLYRLGAAGDTITIAKNPVRDVVFQGNEELYRLWGEGSVLLMQFGLGGAGVVKLYNAGGLKVIAVEGGKIITSGVAGDMTSRFMVDKLGMNETDAMLIGMLAGDVTYGGLNMLHGSLVERYRINSGEEEIVSAAKIGSNGSRKQGYTRDDILNTLDGATEKSTEIVSRLKNGELGLNILGDELFESYLGCSADTVAMQVGDQIYVRSSSASIFSDVVHEGTHAIDFLNGIEEKVIASWEGEINAYGAERLFQIESGMPVQFDTLEDMMIHIWSNYPK